MSTEENKVIARRFIEVWNTGNIDIFDEIIAADCVWRNTDILTIDALKQQAIRFRTAFPNMHLSIEDSFADGDKVAVRLSGSATHTGDYRGIPPSGKKVTWTAIGIFRCTGGKIAEFWSNEDELGRLQQLGVIPPLGESEA